MREIKKIIVNILAVTSLTLLLLIFIAIIVEGVSVHDIGEEYIKVSIFLQILAASILIIGGLSFIQKIESKYAILEFLIGIGYVIIVLLVFGTIFDWFSTRLWILVAMAFVGYMFTLLTNTVRTRKDAREINELLKKIKEKDIDTAS